MGLCQRHSWQDSSRLNLEIPDPAVQGGYGDDIADYERTRPGHGQSNVRLCRLKLLENSLLRLARLGDSFLPAWWIRLGRESSGVAGHFGGGGLDCQSQDIRGFQVGLAEFALVF